MIGSFGWMELLLILIIVLIIFGAGKIPQLGEGLGKAIKGFKKSVAEADAVDVTPNSEQASATPETQPTEEIPPAPERSLADNAVRNAFRAVLGWCPLRDGVPPWGSDWRGRAVVSDNEALRRSRGDTMAWEVGR